MELISQAPAIDYLKVLKNADRHSVLIEGAPGCGKTYLAGYYASLLGIPDFQVVEPTVAAVKEFIDICSMLESPVVVCVENLDTGTPAASYTMLKFLEEPTHNAYIVVTARNINGIPDTIVSRSTVVSVTPPLSQDLTTMATTKYSSRYPIVSSKRIWKCARTFGDVDTIMRMTDSQLEYFDSLNDMFVKPDCVSSLMWKIGHYPDNTDTPVELVIRYIMEISNDMRVKSLGMKCIKDLNKANIAAHIVIAKFCFDLNYGWR